MRLVCELDQGLTIDVLQSRIHEWFTHTFGTRLARLDRPQVDSGDQPADLRRNGGDSLLWPSA